MSLSFLVVVPEGSVIRDLSQEAIFWRADKFRRISSTSECDGGVTPEGHEAKSILSFQYT